MMIAVTIPLVAEAGPIYAVCVRVVNEVGWPLSDIAVEGAQRTGSGDTPLARALTDANGYATLTLAPALDPYDIAIHDNEAPSSPARNGLAYQPDAGSVLVRNDQNTATGCRGSPGIPYKGGQAVVLKIPAQQGILLIHARDGISGDAHPLAGVEVTPVQSASVDIFDPLASSFAFAKTDPEGTLRMACAAGTSANLTFHREAYVLASRAVACVNPGTTATINTIDVDMWRTPSNVDVVVMANKRVGDITGLERAVCVTNTVPVIAGSPCATVDPGQPFCASGLPSQVPSVPCQNANAPADPFGTATDVPLAGATVKVTARPTTLSASTTLCGAGTLRPIDDPAPTLRPGGIPRPTRMGELALQTPTLLASVTPPYVCETPTDSGGRGTLVLPWAERGVGAFRVTISAPGFAPQSVDVTINMSDVVRGSPADATEANVPASAPAERLVRVLLSRTLVSITDKVTDVAGSGVSGATLTFRQGGRTITATTGAGGSFTIPAIESGAYSLTVSKTGSQTRTCQLDVALVSGGAGQIQNANPTYCLTLLSAGKAAIVGAISDDVTGALVPIPGLSICSSALFDNCAATNSAGVFALEVPPNTALGSLHVAPSQDWVDFTTSPTGPATSAGSAGSVITATGIAPRAPLPILVHVRDANGAGIRDANVSIMRGATQIHENRATSDPFQPTNITDANGNNVTAGAKPIWTRRNATPQFDLPTPYVVTARKDLGGQFDDVTHFGIASSAFDLFASERVDHPAGHDVTLILDPVEGIFSIAVQATDVNSGGAAATLVRATVTAPTTPGAGSPAISAGPKSTATTPGQLDLYTGEGNSYRYRICNVATTLYQPSATCATNVAPTTAGPIALSVQRTTSQVHVRGVDPHTGWNITKYNVTSRGAAGFKCNVGGDCAGNTNSTLATNFEWNLTVPWTSTPTQMCLRGTSTADTRVVFVTPTSADENRHGENVAFQPADVCQIYAPGQHYFVNFTPYRAAGAFLQGSVQAAAPLSVDPDVDPDGLQPSAVGGPVLSARAERFEACGIVPTGLTVADVDPSAQLPCASTFECDPIAPNATPGVGFPDCDTGAVDEDGLFSLTLPAMGVNSTWAVSATAPGYYVETYTRWPAVLPITPTFLLYPRAFDAVIRIIDLQNGVAHDCDTEDEDFPLTLGLRDLQDQNGDVNIDTWTATAPITVQEDHSCIAVVHVGDWHRDPQPVPALVGSSWPKTAEPFLVRPQQSGHAGAVVASLGPLGSDRFTNVTMVHGASAPRVPADQVGAIADCIQLDLTPEREPARTICDEFRALNAIATRLVETLTDGPGGVLPIVTGAGDAAAEIAACVQADETPTDDNAAAICEQWRAANDAVTDPPSADDAPDAQENATAIQACVQANATPSQAPATTVCDAFRTVRSGPLAVANEIVACINEDQTPKDANAAAVCDLFRAVAGSAPEVVTPFTITGRVFDGDAIATTNAQLGVPSTVTATPAAGSSCTEVVTANTMPNGSYSLGIPCAGAYTVMAKPLDQLATHWSANTTSTTVSAAAPTATKDVPLERKDVTITVTVRRPPTTAVSGVTVTPVGVDVIGTHASKVSNGGILQWTLPWGVYTLNASNHGAAPSTPIVPMPGQPQTWSATVWAPA